MDENLTNTMPRDIATAVNLLAHPLAGAMAMSALGIGFASQAFGLWVGALSGSAEASQRLLRPLSDESPDGAEARVPAAKARAATETLIADTRFFARKTAKTSARTGGRAAKDAQGLAGIAAPAVAPASAAARFMLEGFRRPKAMDRPAIQDDLKAIAGVGPKLEQVLNGLGVWTYAQIAAWTGEEIAWVDDTLGFKGRIGRDDWIGQAAVLAEDKTLN